MSKNNSNDSARKHLLGYLKVAAQIIGNDPTGSENESEQPPGYSLSWYFNNCIEDDLYPDKDRYSDILDTYLSYIDPVSSKSLDIPKISKKAWEAEDYKLDNLFPQDDNPLNEEQKEAVHKALHCPMSIIWGPPGTGKTETIMHIAALAADNWERVAIVSTTNAAVKNIEEKMKKALDEHDTDSEENSDLAYKASCSYVALGCASDREKTHPVGTPKDETSIGFYSDPNDPHEFPNGKSIGGWEQNIEFDDFPYKIVTCTVHSLKKCFKDGDTKKYDLIIMDEASQTNLIVGIVALSCVKKGGRMVLVGDEEQLPPVITTKHRKAIGSWLDKDENEFIKSRIEDEPTGAFNVCDENLSILSSLHKLLKSESDSSDFMTMLKKHYRCHPAIIGFCNKHIYDGELDIKTEVPEETPPCPISIRYYDGDYRERRWFASRDENTSDSRSSVANCKQALILREDKEEREHLLSLVKEGKTVCFLSPFRAQVRLLKELVSKILEEDTRIPKNIEVKITSDKGASEESEPEEWCALTIHKSQGREFDVVYLLPVEDGNWEWPWAQDKRLVNVAASRAKEELRVILSTKLVSSNMQRCLSHREVPAKNPAALEDDTNNEHMFVQKLVEYTYEYIGELCKPDKKRQESFSNTFGFHKSIIRSIFDEIPWLQTPGNEDKDASAPAKCVEAALNNSDLEGLAYIQNVSFDLVYVNQTTLSSLCDNEWKNPSKVHFDFVIYQPQTKQIVMAIEVDGAHHRYRKNEEGGCDDSVKESDGRKNELVKKCGATLAHLSSYLDIESEVFDIGDEAKHDWACTPNNIPEDSSFVFLRLPSSGVTFWETDTLRNEAKKNGKEVSELVSYVPPTIEDFLRAQCKQNKRHGSRIVSLDLPSMTECLKEWRKDPQLKELLTKEDGRLMGVRNVNKKLLEKGFHYLENNDPRHRRPTKRGEGIGIVASEREDKNGCPYIFLGYPFKAREYLANNMSEILGSSDH